MKFHASARLKPWCVKNGLSPEETKNKGQLQSRIKSLNKQNYALACRKKGRRLTRVNSGY